MIRAISFDVTGTLLKPASTVGEQYANAAKKFMGVSYDGICLQHSFKHFYWKQHENFPMFGIKHNISTLEWWFGVFSNCIKQESDLLISKRNYTDLQLRQAFEHVFYNFEWELCKGVKGTFKGLERLRNEQNKYFKLAALSNSDDRTSEILSSCGILSYFDCVVTSADSKCEKPDPKMFDYMLEKLNLLSIDKKQVLHVGNMYETDYLAAINTGMKALLIRDESNANKKLFCESHGIDEITEVVNFVKKHSESIAL